MDRIRQALDRARFERAIWECAPLERAHDDDVPSAPSPDVARVRFETLPPPETYASQLSEFTDVPANSEPDQQGIQVPAELPLATHDHAQAEGKAPEAVQYPPSAQQQLESFSLDRSLDTKRLRLSGNAPLIVSLLLGVLITVELAHASLLIMSGGPANTEGPPPGPSARAPQRRAFDVHGIVAAHLFGEPAVPSTQDPANARPTTANLLLAGTLATEDPRHGLAIIANAGRSMAYKVGDTVADAELHSVYRDHVLLRRRGILETLIFPKIRTAGKAEGSPPQAPSVAQDAAAADTRQAGMPNTGDVLHGIMTSAQDGTLRGFRVFPSKNRRQFDQAGLRSGDLVVAVNGASLADQDRMAGQQIFNSLKSLSQVTLTVERDGQQHDVTINAAQPDPPDPPDPPEQSN